MADYLKATTLTECVNGVGRALGGLIPEYKIVRFYMGHDPSLVDVPSKTVQSMPLDTSVRTGEFYTAPLTSSDFVWDGNRLLVRCICPEDVLLEPHEFSTIYLEDNLGNLCHGMVKLTDNVLPETGAEVWIYVEFPINTSAQ